MVLGNVQGLKVVVVGFHLGTVGDFKAHADKNLLDLIEDNGQGMLSAKLGALSRQGHIQLLAFQPGSHLACLDFRQTGLDIRFDPGTDLVGQLADHRALLRRELSHLL